MFTYSMIWWKLIYLGQRGICFWWPVSVCSSTAAKWLQLWLSNLQKRWAVAHIWHH